MLFRWLNKDYTQNMYPAAFSFSGFLKPAPIQDDPFIVANFNHANDPAMDRMCSGPYCKTTCCTVIRSGATRRRHMVRAYIRVYDERRHMHTVPVGWWCPACHAFTDDVKQG